MIYPDFAQELEKIDARGLRRHMRVFESPQQPRAVVDGREIRLFASNSYLGLSNHPSVLEAAQNALARYGSGSGGSRLTTGTYTPHVELETEIADFKGTEAALVLSSGFLTNSTVITAITDPTWTVFCDKLNHASIIDGCRHSGARFVPYAHADMSDLEKKVRQKMGGKGLIVTDGVFSMDGDIAPLPAIVDIAARYGLMTMVDDAHAAGVLGATGAGTSEYYQVKGKVDIEMGTLSKAFAAEGGYIASSRALIDFLIHRARGFIFSTAMAPHTAAAALAAIRICRAEPGIRRHLLELSRSFAAQIAQTGFTTSRGETPILPVLVKTPENAVHLSRALWDEGFFVPAIRPPTVKESRLRFSLMASHTHKDCEDAALALARAAGKAGIRPEALHD